MAISGFHILAVISLIIGGIVYYTMHRKVVKVTKKPVNRADTELVIPARFQFSYDHGIDPEGFKICTFYTLTQCVHCGRLEKYLEVNRIPFTKVLLDNYEGLARRNLMEKLRTYNPRGSFPTLVSPEGEVTVGFREAQVKEIFGKYENTSSTEPRE